ncbi:MAG TPA: nucleotidyltransferase family protein [Vicinamibacterales bacterium]
MKAFLLAAGEGRRLRPLTETTPKCLIPIRGTPLMALWLELLERHGVTDVLVNLHHARDRVLAFLQSYQTSIRVSLVHEEQLLGSAGTVAANRQFVDGEDRFLIVYADNLTNVDLTRMIRFHDGRCDPVTIGVTRTDKPREKGTVVLDHDRRVVAFEEKAEHPRSDLANAGIYVAGPGLFSYFPDRLADGTVLDFGHHIFPRMIPNIGAYEITEFLLDIGTMASYEAGQAIWPGL